MNPSTIIIPLGTHCNSASIIKDKLGMRQSSFPFDWIDVSLQTILQYLKVPRSQIDAYFTDYISKLTLIDKPNNAWYPHELVDHGDVVRAIADKYIRRYHRMHDAFESGNDILFLTAMPHMDYDVRNVHYDAITERLIDAVKGKCIFVSINVSQKDFDKQLRNGAVHINRVVPLNNDWGNFDKTIADIVRQALTK